MFKVLAIVIAWCILFALSWPLALLALVLTPLAFIITLPFMILAFSVRVVAKLLKGLLLVPAYCLGWRPKAV